MSETVPQSPAPLPVAGTTSPEADASAASASAASAPAADSPSTPSPEVTTPAAESTPPSSLLGTAKPESQEPAAAAQDGDASTSPLEAPAEPLPLPAYEPFTIPEGVTIDVGKINEFQTLLGTTENRLTQTPAEAHAAMQELGQQLLATHIQALQDIETQQTARSQEVWTETRKGWRSDAENDRDIGGERLPQVLRNAGEMISSYGQKHGQEREQALRKALGVTGAGDHPALIHFFDHLSDFVVEKSRMVAATGIRGPQPMSRAQRMYRNSIPPNGAA